MATGTPERSERPVGRHDPHPDLVGPLRRALTRSTRVLELLPAQTPLLPKVLGECAMLVHAAAPLRGTMPCLRDAVDGLADRVAAGTRTRDTALRILLEPAHALDHASAHLLLGSAGYPDPAFDQHVLSATAPGRRRTPGPERLPHRELEQRWLGRILGLPGDDGEAALLAASALGRPLDPLAATRLDVYAFTHCVMYAHDLGRRSPPLPRPPGEVLADAEAGLALAVDSGDLDLAVELLLTWPLMGVPLGPSPGHVLDRVLRTEARLGFLPGLGHDPAHDETTALLANYHPTTVMGMFAALAVRAGTEVAVPAPAGPAGTAAVAAAWPGPVPSWVAEALTATPPASGIEPLVLTAALRTAVGRVDLEAVRALLTVALEHDLELGPAVRAATGLVARLSRPGAPWERAEVSPSAAPRPA